MEKEEASMRKLFTGRFGRIPAAVLAALLISVMVAGGMVAATGGYTLWSGSVSVNVQEPITIKYGPTSEDCNSPLSLTSALDFTLYAGCYVDKWFSITSLSDCPVLVKAVTTVSDVSVVFAFDPLIGPDGVQVDSDHPLLTRLRISVDGAATPGAYSGTLQFTRESVPTPP